MKRPDDDGWNVVIGNPSLNAGKKNSVPQNPSKTKVTKKTSIKEKKNKENTKEKAKRKPKEKKKNSSNDGKPESSRRKISVGSKEIEIETPPKTLVLIWLLVAAELCFDLITSAIAFAAFLQEPEECCGETISTGATPLGSTISFLFLVIAELIFLLRAIKLTLWPNPSIQEAEAETKSSCLRPSNWGPKFFIWLVNFLTVINPYFGLIIAWMLMYQSDKNEALTVMALEAVTIILHFLSVYIEKSAQTWKGKLLHGSVIIPWLATLSINIWYLNQGGVCYDTSLKTFWYTGCEICANGERLVNGTWCPVMTDNTTTFEKAFIWELESDTFCEDGGNKVCWFDY